jgi:hypothetical protein
MKKGVMIKTRGSSRREVLLLRLLRLLHLLPLLRQKNDFVIYSLFVDF